MAQQGHRKAGYEDVSIEKLAQLLVFSEVTWWKERCPHPAPPCHLEQAEELPLRSSEQELALPLTCCITLESRPWPSPGQHSRAEPGREGMDKLVSKV